MNALATAAHWLSAAVFPVAVAWAVVSDVRRLVIPNWTCLAVALAYLPAALLAGLPGAVIGVHYAVGGALLAGGLILFQRRIVGGGDVKLLAAAGVWAGWPGMGSYLMLVAVIGGVLAVAVLGLRRFGGGGPFRALPWIDAAALGAQPIPYGVAIGIAAIVVFAGNPALPPSWTAAFGT